MKNIKLSILLACTLIVSISKAQTDKKPADFVLGQVRMLHSEILNEDRTLNIYLPEGYKKDNKYPVIYLLDGAADEDFIHIVGLVQYNTFSWIDRIPKSIVVGIANTDRKRDFTGPTLVAKDKEWVPSNGGSAKFISFLEKELQPYIEKEFTTNGSRTIIGQSLGGLLATEILFSKPRLFDKYIIVSPSLWWNDGALLSKQPEALKADYPIKTDIYIGVGKEGSMDGTKKHIMEADAKLLAEKIKKSGKNVTVYFDYLPAETHATVTHPAVFNAFRYLYPVKKK
jgi:predicted alpha/beta superfamily hydrolase